MALLNLKGLGTSSLRPVSVTARCQARASSCTISALISTKPRKNCGIQHRSCGGGGFWSSGSKDLLRWQRLQALSFQVATADHDNNGGEHDPVPSPSPSSEQQQPATTEVEAPATDSSSSLELQGKEHLRQMLVDSLQGFQEGLKDLRDRGVLESAKLGYQDAQEKVKNLDAKQLITDLTSSDGARWWRDTDPWIKWPIAIFVPFYLLVTLGFGLAVSQELVPLWILGPLSTGIIIRQFCRAAELSRVLAEKTAAQRAQLRETSLAIVNDAKEGTLPGKAKVLVESKLHELEEKVSTKRSEITVYVSSGQAAANVKDFSLNKLHEVGENAVELYADYMEWWRPKGRELNRWLKKVF